MAIPDPSSCDFYHFTRKFEDSERQYTWDNWIKIGLLPSNLCRLVGMNFYTRKRHTFDGWPRGRPSHIICSRNFKTLATPRLRKDQDNSFCVRFLEIEDI